MNQDRRTTDMSCSVCMGINSHLCPVCGKDREVVECMKCRGWGVRNCTAISLRTGKEIEVTAETYISIPATEDEARATRRWYYQGEADRCECCGGLGEMYKDSDGRLYPLR